MQLTPDDLFFYLVLLPPLILSLTVHEFAHARTALAFGDETARLLGRVSLNPLRHLDPLGTLVLLLTQGFGWAKPVPVNIANLHPPRLGDIAVSLAGPFSNLMLAALSAVIVRILLACGIQDETHTHQAIYRVLVVLIQMNIGLAVFNLLPLFPLDGHHIARNMLPAYKQVAFMQWQMQTGRILLLIILFAPRLLSNILNRDVFNPIAYCITNLLVATVRLFHIGPAFHYAFP